MFNRFLLCVGIGSGIIYIPLFIGAIFNFFSQTINLDSGFEFSCLEDGMDHWCCGIRILILSAPVWIYVILG
jgi:hypothetical protein